ncbi:hypothetical protein BT96DRAFT_945669 [Gymnopus androsaceus JB14]|uniref:Uncharacterized protein n=1 Tax=Gymnopus androsaceus JB14 TaxID=1447944 RepID=A0A6A4GZX2_9AGAR|nr:hypothetical protein BT96DRAFT_945669 [Gymnopus androsaceus JB14]
MYPFVALACLVSLLPSVLVAADQALTLAQITSPTNGTDILPGETFPFDYRTMGDLNSGVSSYTCTCWYFTGPVEGFQATPYFATGHLIGAFSLGNYSDLDSDYPSLPSRLTMPYFSVLPGNGEGESVSNQPVFIGCMEEYGYDAKQSVGSLMSFCYIQIMYNGTDGN